MILSSCSDDGDQMMLEEETELTLEECIELNSDMSQSLESYLLFQENRARWRCQEISSYSFIVSQFTGINQCRQAEFKVVVEDSLITSTELVNDANVPEWCSDELQTFEAFFNFIDVAVNDTIPTGWRDVFNDNAELFLANSTDITYDEDFGFPVSIFIDYDRSIADEELFVNIRDFELP